jgi:hypothetical protein
MLISRRQKNRRPKFPNEFLQFPGHDQTLVSIQFRETSFQQFWDHARESDRQGRTNAVYVNKS